MYKKAQLIQFQNQDLTERTFSRMRESDFSEWISVLSQVHELLAQEPSKTVSEAFVDVLGDAGSGYSRYVTNYIGEQQFRTNRFDDISTALQALRKPAEAVREDMPAQPDKPDFSDDIERVKNQQYPEEERKKVELALFNLELHRGNLEKEINPDDIAETSNQIIGIIAELDRIADVARKTEVEEGLGELTDRPDETSEEETAGEDVSDGEKKVAAGESKFSEEDRKEHAENKGLLYKINSSLNDDSALNHPILRGLDFAPEGGITPESIGTVIASLEQAFEKAKGGFRQFHEYAEQLVSQHVPSAEEEEQKKKRVFKREHYKIDEKYLIGFNNLIYAIKAADLLVMSGIAQAIKSGEHGPEFASELMALEDKLMTKAFSEDEAFFKESIILTISYFSVRDIGLLYAGIKTWEDFDRTGKNGVMQKPYQVLTESYAGDVAGGRDLVSDTEAMIFKMMWAKFKQQMDLNSHGRISQDNFLLNVAIRRKFVSDKLYSGLKDDKEFVNIVKCPTCTRPIKWSGKALKQVDLFQARGAYLPLYSVFGKSVEAGRTSRYLITEEMLAEGGPYDPPNPSDYGYWKQMDITKERVKAYEGKKTWAEIHELIYSNDPVKHEEGLHRRAAAMKQLGAEPIASTLEDGTKSRTKKVADISSIMFSCPFSKQFGTSVTGEGQEFNVKVELERVSKQDYPKDPESVSFVESAIGRLNVLRVQFGKAIEEGGDDEAIRQQMIDIISDLDELAGVSPAIEEVEEEEAFTESGCGLKLNPISEGARALQYGANSNPSSLSYTWSPKKLNDEQRISAKERMSGGYKFSKTFFKCPARIPDPASSDFKKHKSLAIPKAGPVGIGSGEYVPPISATGYAEYDQEIEEGTFSYLVCGTATSLSSFDRSADGDGSVYAILKRLWNAYGLGVGANGEKLTSKQRFAAKDIIDFLITEGIDSMDLIRAIEIARTEPEQKTEASLKKCRLRKIADMLVLAARRLPNEFAEIEDLVLVCPHGHKFSIKQSVGFSETHSSVDLSGFTRGYSVAKELFVLSGYDSLESAKRLGFLIKAREGDDVKTFDQIGPGQQYDKSQLGFLLPSSDGEMEMWKIHPKMLSSIRLNIFQDSPGFAQQISKTAVEQSGVRFGSQFLSDIVNSSNDKGDKERSRLEDAAFAKDAKEKSEEASELSRAIEGLSPKDFEENAAALARALRGALKVSITWNNRAIDSNLFRKVVSESDFDAEAIVSDFLKSSGAREAIYYEGEDIPAEIISQLAETLIPRLKAYTAATGAFYGRENIAEVAASLLTAAFIDAVEQIETETGLIDLDWSTDKFDETFGKVIPFFEPYEEQYNKLRHLLTNEMENERRKGADVAKSVPQLSMFYVIEGHTVEVEVGPKGKPVQKRTMLRREYGEKVFLVSYAQYLANAIASIYNETMAPGRSIAGAYIGYDIGLDLSSAEKIFELSSDDLRNIQEQPDFVATPREKMIATKNIIAVYNMIISRMAVARNMAITPVGLRTAKTEILAKVGGEGAQADPVAHGVFSAAFPVQTVDFGMHLSPGSFIPDSFGLKTAAGKGRALPTEPNVGPPSKVPLMQSDGTPVLTRTGQQRYMEAYTHLDSGYDGTKFQVGMISGKTENMRKWPITGGDGFVGVLLPLSREGGVPGSAVSTLSEAPISDFRFVVNIEGEPQDISFLFRRGRNEDQIALLSSLYRKIDALEEQRADYLEDAETEEEISAIDNHFDNAIREVQSAIRSIPIAVKTSRSYVESKDPLKKAKWASMPHPSATLVSPVDAINLINNSHRFEGMLSTRIDRERLMNFIIKAYGLEYVRDLFQKAYDETDGLESKEFTVLSMFNFIFERDNPSHDKFLSKLNSSLDKNYATHLGQFFNMEPHGNGDGSFMNVMEMSVPGFRRKKGTYEISPEQGLGTPPSLKLLSARLKKETPMAGGFGISPEGTPAGDFLSKAQEAMLKYVRAHATGELGVHTVEADLKTDYLKKIAQRRKSWERIILTMGYGDIEVDDLL